MADIKGIAKKVYFSMVNPLFVVPVGDDAPKEVNMLVETPMDSINKYEYHTETGILKLDRVIFENLPYPVEYGAIPQTIDAGHGDEAGDGDPLDVMCIMTRPTFPGCLVSVRPIGVMMFSDSGEIDNKILAVPKDDIRFKHIQDLSDLTDHKKDEIAFFFERYKDLQFKYKNQTGLSVKVEGWKSKEDAYKIIEMGVEAFNKKYAEELKDIK